MLAHSNKPNTVIHLIDFIGVVIGGPVSGQASQCKYNNYDDERSCLIQIYDYKHLPIFIHDPIIT